MIKKAIFPLQLICKKASQWKLIGFAKKLKMQKAQELDLFNLDTFIANMLGGMEDCVIVENLIIKMIS